MGETFSRVVKVFCSQKDFDFDIEKHHLIRDDLGVDSLCFQEILMVMEDEFDVDISDEESFEFKTIGDVVEWLEKRL